MRFQVGDRVEKFTGDYKLTGEVRSVFYTCKGKLRYVVDHTPTAPGMCHIYSNENLRKEGAEQRK